MKSTADLVQVQGWIRKADSDLAGAALCLASGVALDTACFHAQQASEKLIKAYRIGRKAPGFSHGGYQAPCLPEGTKFCVANTRAVGYDFHSTLKMSVPAVAGNEPLIRPA